MSNDLRDQFGSDEEYEEFRNSYNDYKNQTGMFDLSNFIKKVIEYQKLLYQSFVVDKKKYIEISEEFTEVKNLPMYVFYFETLPDTDTVVLIMN
jgi:hypothetical protein